LIQNSTRLFQRTYRFEGNSRLKGTTVNSIRLLSVVALSVAALSAAPTIGSILNNYSYTVPTSPNYGIAQGSIFVIFGTQLSNASTGLQNVPLSTMLQGVSVTVAVGDVTKLAFLYYVTPTQIAGILPSSVPVGTGTIIVNNNGQVSSAAPLKVIQSDFGILTLDGSGAGGAAVYDVGFKFLSATNSTKPNDVIQIFGTGVGPTSGDETVPQIQTNLTNIPMTAEIGGVQAEILYRGRTIFPGLDQINVKIPALSSTAYGCNVSLVIKSGAIASNNTTIPVAQNGGACPVPAVTGGNVNSAPTPSEISAWAAAGTYTVGSLSLLRSTGHSVRDVSGGTATNITKFDGLTGSFSRLSGPDLARTLNNPVVNPQAGTCTVITTTTIPNITSTPLDAGPSVSVSGPNGLQIATLFQPGLYTATVPNTYMAPGRYTFTGRGGRDVGSFSGTLDVSPELIWTNVDAATVVTRSGGITVQWTGGDPTQLITIVGQSSVSTSNFATFFCWANNSAGQFTVPANILNQLPASTVSSTGAVSRGSLTIYSYFSTRLTAPGIDLFTASGEWSVTVTSQYK
jgi:uncharacterized protein (TIGR03437 family)